MRSKALLLPALFLIACSAQSFAGVTIEKVNYSGWPDAYRLQNESCEMVIVPQVGRVMSFALAGGQNALYNNPELAGQTVARDDHEWHNFGGDKVWPTPQDLWERYTDRKGWPPPYHFDAAPQSAEPIENGVRLSSPLSPEFGTRTIREFVMDPHKPLVVIRQRFKKESGKPVVMSFWTVTQVRQPDYAMLPLGEPVDGKPFKNLANSPPNARIIGSLLTISNDPKKPQKVGTTPSRTGAESWVAAVFGNQLFVESRKVEPRGGYPDGNCPGEIFTADAPLKLYVEIELLSPLREVRPGDELEGNCVWQLANDPKVQTLDAARAGEMARDLHREAIKALDQRSK